MQPVPQTLPLGGKKSAPVSPRFDAQTPRWKTTSVRSRLPPRRAVCSAQRDPLADAATGDELWLGDELLAKIARLARGGHLATDPLRLARLASALRADRLVTSSRGRQFRASGFWGAQTGPNPTDRAKLGSKRHLICDGRGVRVIQLTGANRNDSQQALALIDAIPALQGDRGRPRNRPDCVLGDRGYDAEAIRRGLRARHIVPWFAKRSTEHGSGLGRWRWVVERTFAWLNQFRRLRIRYEKRADIHEAFLALGCIVICWRFLSG
jgi:transposase